MPDRDVSIMVRELTERAARRYFYSPVVVGHTVIII